MKYSIIITFVLLLTSAKPFAQSYPELMQKQKEILSSHTEFSIKINQKAYVADVLDKGMSFSTKIMGKAGRLFWQTPELTIIHNERAYLMIRDEEKIMMYSPFAEVLDIKAEVNASLSNWENALEKYIASATSIEKMDNSDSYGFIIKTDKAMASTAKVKFDKTSGLMTWMEILQKAKNGETTRLVYQIDYDFQSSVSANLFDETRIVTAGETPSGKGKYAKYKVIYNPAESPKETGK